MGGFPMAHVFEVMQEQKIVAVLRRIPASAGSSVVEALAAGGVRLIEVTMDNPEAAHLIDGLTRSPDAGIRVGAGTVMTREHLRDAVAAGAAFAVSPHWDPELWAESVRLNIPYVPGAMTPSEIAAASRAGAVMVKVFPAGPLGSGYIRELRGPFGEPRIMVTGGIHAANILDYLKAGADVFRGRRSPVARRGYPDGPMGRDNGQSPRTGCPGRRRKGGVGWTRCWC